MDPLSFLFIGLGNPGTQYRHTRHNAGFRVMDHVAAEKSLKFRKPFLRNVLIARGVGDTDSFFLAKPLSYMNRSGSECPYLLKRASAETPLELFVVLDNLDLPPGEIRIKTGGGSAGHNGLASVIEGTSGRRLHRIFIGIGRPMESDVISHVLGTPGEEERIRMEEGEKRACNAVLDLLKDPLERVMNVYNRRNSSH